MCMMDWRIGRLIRSKQVENNGSMGPIFIGRNNQRVAVAVSMAIQQPITVDETLYIRDDSQVVLALTANNMPYIVSLLNHGDLVTRDLSFTTESGGTPILVREYFMPEEYLQAGIDEFISQYRYPK